jgi:hypothetical protein
VRAHNQLTNNHNYHDNLLHKKVIPGVKRLIIGAKVADRRGIRLKTKLQVMNGKLRALEEKMQVQAEVMNLQEESTAMMQEEYDILRFEVKEAGKREAVLNSVVKSLANELDTLKASIAAGSSSSSGSRDSALTVMMMAKMENYEDVRRVIREKANMIFADIESTAADKKAKAETLITNLEQNTGGYRTLAEQVRAIRPEIQGLMQSTLNTQDIALVSFYKLALGQVVAQGDFELPPSANGWFTLYPRPSAMLYIQEQLEFFKRKLRGSGMAHPSLINLV